MELTYQINKYGHKMVKCPFCPRECCVREARPNPLCNLIRHLTVEAKTEALEACIRRKDYGFYKCLHLDYYRDHTTPQVETRKTNRMFDDSLSVAN